MMFVQQWTIAGVHPLSEFQPTVVTHRQTSVTNQRVINAALCWNSWSPPVIPLLHQSIVMSLQRTVSVCLEHYFVDCASPRTTLKTTSGILITTSLQECSVKKTNSVHMENLNFTNVQPNFHLACDLAPLFLVLIIWFLTKRLKCHFEQRMRLHHSDINKTPNERQNTERVLIIRICSKTLYIKTFKSFFHLE